ncbi:hypothetical protein ACFOYU_02140 [Microvirga sp. GCM10011540]|uniref:hypothetical protein n=1 Tax=Microvirga sp. GCM10011540 TaxID=3317338 RepID=UPI0036183D4F
MKPLYLIPLLALSSPAVAQTSEDYARIGLKSHSVWSCSILARYVEDIPEAERLFTLGYDLGKTFVEAIKAGKVAREDLGKYPQIMFSDLVEGPSTDFILGRMYEVVIKRTAKEAFDTTKTSEELKEKASGMSQRQNCSFMD